MEWKLVTNTPLNIIEMSFLRANNLYIYLAKTALSSRVTMYSKNTIKRVM